jgi:hypothetical protein
MIAGWPALFHLSSCCEANVQIAAAMQRKMSTVRIFEPRPWTTAMITTEMPAAISPYSIAVAPLLRKSTWSISYAYFPVL